MTFNRIKLISYLVIFMSFFIYGGYYAGLALVLSTGNALLSKLYTLPIRGISFLIALAFILNRANKTINIRKIDFLIFLFFAFYVLKVLYTGFIVSKGELRNVWYYYILYFLLFNYSVFLFFRNLDIKKYLGLIIETILISGFVLALVVIIFYRDVLFASQVGRFGNTVKSENVVLSPLAVAYTGAMNVCLLIPYISQNFNKASFKKKFYLISNFLLSMFLFVMGATRGAFVVVILSLLFFLYSQQGLKKLKYLLLLIPLVPMFFLYLDYTGSALLSRLTNTVENSDSSGRDILWADAWKEFVNYPFLGGKIEVSGIYPHNIILEIMMAMGIVGLILFILILIQSFSKIRINNSTIYIFIIFINALFQYMFSGSIYLAIILFFALGLFNGYKYGENGNLPLISDKS